MSAKLSRFCPRRNPGCGNDLELKCHLISLALSPCPTSRERKAPPLSTMNIVFSSEHQAMDLFGPCRARFQSALGILLVLSLPPPHLLHLPRQRRRRCAIPLTASTWQGFCRKSLSVFVHVFPSLSVSLCPLCVRKFPFSPPTPNPTLALQVKRAPRPLLIRASGYDPMHRSLQALWSRPVPSPLCTPAVNRGPTATR